MTDIYPTRLASFLFSSHYKLTHGTFEDEVVACTNPNFDDIKIPQGTLTSVIPSDTPVLGDHVSI